MQTVANSIKRHIRAPRAGVLVRLVAMTAASLVVGLAAAWTLAAAWLSARATVEAPGPAAADELLAFAAASLALVIAAWLVVGTVLEVLSHLPGRIGATARLWSDRLTPALARRIAAFVLGVGVGVAGGPTQAVASPRSSSLTSSVADPGFLPTNAIPGTPALDPGFTPSPVAPGFTPTAPRVRPQADPGLLGGRSPAASAAPTNEVVVHRGDSLWSIAAHHLGPDASDAEIARAWPQWFELNRDVIGHDPDVILPGQILRAPGDAQKARVIR